MTRAQAESGFSLVELTVATALLLVVSAIVTTALTQATSSQKTIWNRTEMHSGIRGATELLQQEVGQAGRIALPGPVTVTGNPVTAVPASPTACVVAQPALSDVTGMWGDAATGVALTFLDGDNTETVRMTVVDPSTKQVTGCFWHNHAVGAAVAALGGFATGIAPPTGIVNGSDANTLKLYGDINGDGKLMYIEYVCDQTVNHNLYRNVMAYNAANKPPLTDSMILLSNVYPNDPDVSGAPRPCFTYQTSTISVSGTPFTFVLDVAVTLTVQTQQIDPITRQYQKETKALLNVSPRNVFNTWTYAGMGYSDRIQSTPVSLSTLLAPAP